jgi:hypothetical protein
MAGILAMAVNTKKPPQRDGFSEESIKVVAGVGFVQDPTMLELRKAV